MDCRGGKRNIRIGSLDDLFQFSSTLQAWFFLPKTESTLFYPCMWSKTIVMNLRLLIRNFFDWRCQEFKNRINFHWNPNPKYSTVAEWFSFNDISVGSFVPVKSHIKNIKGYVCWLETSPAETARNFTFTKHRFIFKPPSLPG